MKNILVTIDQINSEQQIKLAKAASQMFDAEVSCLYLNPVDTTIKPDLQAALSVATPQPVVNLPVLPTSETDNELLIKSLRDKVSRIKSPNGKSFKLIESNEPARAALMHYGLYQDLLIINKDLKTTDMIGVVNDGANDVAAHSHRPVLALPAGAKAEIFEGNALIIWNDSPKTASAIQQALPLLQQAGSVTIMFLNEGKQRTGTASDLQMATLVYLQLYGIQAHSLHTQIDSDVKELFLSMTLDGEFDYVVAGVYEQSKLRQIFGDTIVRDMLESTQLPVLLAA